MPFNFPSSSDRIGCSRSMMLRRSYGSIIISPTDTRSRAEVRLGPFRVWSRSHEQGGNSVSGQAISPMLECLSPLGLVRSENSTDEA